MTLLIKFLILSIKSILWLLDKDHRTIESIDADGYQKFTHVVSREFESDFSSVYNVVRTIPYIVWELKTENHTLYAADKHMVVKSDNSTSYVEDLQVGDFLKTKSGLDIVTSVRSLGIRTHQYSLMLNELEDQDSNLYFTNGIISHNTTTSAAYLLWYAMFNRDKTVLIAANVFSGAIEIMDRIKFAYENLEEFNWLRCGVLSYNKMSIVFDNGSRIIARATSPNAGRGLAISKLYLDEFDFVQPSIAESFMTSIRPTLSTGGSCIITSTPNYEDGEFAKIWFGSQERTDPNGEEIPNGLGRNEFFGMSVTWDKHPDRDESWKRTQLNQMSTAKFSQEFECKFITSDETLIDSEFLSNNLKGQEPLFRMREMRWYVEPKANHVYGVTLDPSLGTGSDFAAIQVFDYTTMEQVAEWRSCTTVTQDQVEMLRKTVQFLSYTLSQDTDQSGEPEIYWTLENNTVGEGALVAIAAMGEDTFPGVFVHEPKRESGGRKGLNTNTRTKITACLRAKVLIESYRLKIYSKALISELRGFVRGGGSFKGKPGIHDDLVMAMLNNVRLLHLCANWQEEIEHNVRYIEEEDEELNDPPMPIVL
jgi:hypothetical protein